MTDRETDPSLPSITPLPSRDNAIAIGDGEESREPAAPASAPTNDAGEPTGDPQAGSSRPRMRVVIYPPEPRVHIPGAGGVLDEARSTGAASASELEPSRDVSGNDGGVTSPQPSKKVDIDPVDRLVEYVFPTRSLTDWLLQDPLNRWQLYGEAIAKDRAGVDAALARAREHGYTASRFTDALKVVVNDRNETAADLNLGLAPAPTLDERTVPDRTAPASSERPSLFERLRLNFHDSHYRGTLAGTYDLYDYHKRSRLAEGEEETPDRLIEMDFFRAVHEGIKADLDKFDRMPAFQNVPEAIAALVGQIGASFTTPETFIALPVRGASLLVRAAVAGLGQAALEVVVDPIQQHLSIEAGVQEKYDPRRTVERAGLRFATGAAWRVPTDYAEFNRGLDKARRELSIAVRDTPRSAAAGLGPDHGKLVHGDFAAIVRERDLPGIRQRGVEESFKGGASVRYGFPGSGRPDVIWRFYGVPSAVFELKPITNPMQAKQINKYLTHVRSDIKIYELQYPGGPIRRRWPP